MAVLKGNPDFASFKKTCKALLTVFYKHDFKVYVSERDSPDTWRQNNVVSTSRIDVDISLF